MDISTKFTSVLFVLAATVACSDPAASVDAPIASCECPASESPLQGRIVTEVSPVGQLAIEVGTSKVGNGCASPNAILLSGGCQIEEPALEQSPDFRLVDSYKLLGTQGGKDGWVCTWYNSGTVVGHASMTLTCLNPAQ